MPPKGTPRILKNPTLPVTEGEVLSQCRDYLRLKGWSVWRHQAGPLSPKGFPDLIAIHNEVVLMIEVKKPTGTQSDYQKKFQAAWEAQGGNYVLARGVGDIMTALAKVAKVTANP